MSPVTGTFELRPDGTATSQLSNEIINNKLVFMGGLQSANASLQLFLPYILNGY